MNEDQLTHQPSVKLAKHELRTALKRKRNHIDADQRKQDAKQACRRAAQLLEELRHEQGRPLTVCAYMPFGPELDIIPLMEACLSSGDQMYIPRTLQDTHTLEWVGWNMSTPFKSGVFGIREPADEAEAVPIHHIMNNTNIVLVPGLGFDRTGGRLGMGAGYYDRFLSLWESAKPIDKPRLLSIIYNEQLVVRVPVEPHDAMIDILVTPSQVIPIKKAGF